MEELRRLGIYGFRAISRACREFDRWQHRLACAWCGAEMEGHEKSSGICPECLEKLMKEEIEDDI